MRCVGTGERFGADLSARFDWNDDGADDLAVGAPDRFGAAAYAGGVDVFFGGTGADSLPDVVIGDAPADLHLGKTVAGGQGDPMAPLPGRSRAMRAHSRAFFRQLSWPARRL